MKIILLLLSLWLPLSLDAAESKVIGVIDGQKVTLQDIEDKELNDLRKKVYQKTFQQFQQTALKKLWAKGKLKRPTPKKATRRAVKAFFEANQLSQRGSLEEFAPRIRQHLESLGMMRSAQQQFELALKKGWVQPRFTAPNDFTLEVPLATGYRWKNTKGKVMLLEFSDFQCPFCGRVQGSLKTLRKKYRNQVVFAYRHLPLPFHTEADEAANAVECAREQGKFEPFHNLLFQNQKAQSDLNLLAYGKRVGIQNSAKFKRCVKSLKYQARVQADIQYAQSIGINGTPTFVIGRFDPRKKTVKGEVISGALPLSKFEELIQKYLK